MGILDEDVQRVRAGSDLVQVAGEHIALRRVGRRWVGLCPFHAEKTPSFSVNAELGLYYCFGCGAKGDVITFVREVQHLEFAEAVERLGARAGIQVRYDSAVASREHQRRSALVEAMARAVDWYQDRLLSAADARPARAYLRSLGYDGEIVRAYRLGWAPDEWDALVRSLRLPVDVLRDTGLGFLNRRQRQQDSFRGRIMFPIFDTRGDPVAFGGRHLDGAPPPKYKNSQETPIYSKSRVLYGLNWAKGAVVEAGEVVVCEGYTDVIGLAKAGVPRAVAPCGTAVADEHFHMLKNFARRVVLAFDSDAAGQAAAERFYEWERRYDLDIAVARLPPGTDPADLARSDPEALRSAVAEARPFLAFRLERALERADLASPEGRARAAEAAMAVVGEHPSGAVRDQYLMQVAARTRVQPERLRELAATPQPGPHPQAGARPQPGVRASKGSRREPRPELEALRLAVHHPEAVAGRLEEALFADEVVLGALRALRATTTLHEALGVAGPEAAALLQRLAVEDTDSDADDVLARLADQAARRELAKLEAEASQAEDPVAYSALIGWLKPTIEELAVPQTRVQASDRLVPWIVERLEVEP